MTDSERIASLEARVAELEKLVGTRKRVWTNGFGKRGCYYVRDKNGYRTLIPGCYGSANRNDDKACTCGWEYVTEKTGDA